MKRIFALLLAVSMVLSLTLPAYAEEAEVVEEIVEEVLEEVTEEIEEEITEEPVKEVVEETPEEVTEEIVEEVVEAEEVVGEIIFGSASSQVAGAEARSNKCYDCALLDKDVDIGECRDHHGEYRLWMHMPQREMEFLRGFGAFCGESFTTKLVVGNMVSQRAITSVSVHSLGEDNVPYRNPEALTVTMAEPAEGDPWPDFTITVNQPGLHFVRFEESVDGKMYSYDVDIRGLGENDVLFYATKSDGTGYYSSIVGNGIWHDPFQENYAGGDYKLYLKTSTYEQQISPERLFTTADSISISAKENGVAHVEMSAAMDGMIGYVEWNNGNCKTYYISAGYDGPDAPVDNQPAIYFRPAGSEELLTSLTLEANVPVIGELLYGSTGAYIPLPNFDRYDGQGVNVDPYEGMSKLTGFFVGARGTIYFGNASFTAKVPNPDAGDIAESTVKKLFAIGGGPSGSTIHTHWDLSLNPENPDWSMEYGRMLYFGTSESNRIVARGVRVVTGDSIELTERQNDYKFVAKKTGYTILGYTDQETGLEYYFPVCVSVGGNNSNKMARNYVPIGNITSGMGLTGWAGMETLDYYSQIGNYYVPGSTDPFMCTLGLLVRENEQYVDINRLSDVSFEILGCNVSDAVTLGEMFTYTEAGRFSTYAVRVSGRANTSYQATVAVSYTLDGTKRFTHQINLFRNPNFQEVEIFATEENLGTAGQLNAVLSSWESFTAWVMDTQEIEIIPGMPVKLHLPVVSYDDVIVAQSMSPMNRNNAQPITLIQLWGSEDEEGNRTTMCGLIEKASLVSIGFIDFKAVKGKTMTTTGEKKAFTCGILADYKNTFVPVYDQTYLNKYANGQQPSLVLPEDRIQDYGDIFNTTIDLGQVHNCRFTGFDYGTRSTPYGFIGSQQYCVYKDNYYGIYMDNNGSGVDGGDDSADAGNATFTDYTRLTFENNEYAVRIVTIPCDASDYRVRVHDSNFIDNFREFWIDEDGLFYFYRNYFAGKWHENQNHHGNWEEYKDKIPTFDNTDVETEYYYVISEHRPGRVHYDKGDPSAADTLVIVNPCRKSPDFNENTYWFYSGEDQYTLIERGDDTMPISGDAVAELKGYAEISVVKNGKPVITYTFQGNGGKTK